MSLIIVCNRIKKKRKNYCESGCIKLETNHSKQRVENTTCPTNKRECPDVEGKDIGFQCGEGVEGKMRSGLEGSFRDLPSRCFVYCVRWDWIEFVQEFSGECVPEGVHKQGKRVGQVGWR